MHCTAISRFTGIIFKMPLMDQPKNIFFVLFNLLETRFFAGFMQGHSKPKLENLEPRTQDLARFSNSDLFQAEPKK